MDKKIHYSFSAFWLRALKEESTKKIYIICFLICIFPKLIFVMHLEFKLQKFKIAKIIIEQCL